MTNTPGARRTSLPSLSTPVARLATGLVAGVVAVAAVVLGLTLVSGGGATAAIGQPRAAVDVPAPAPAAAAPAGDDDAPVERERRSASADEPVSPQMQLDDTDAERNARIGAWQDCLVEHGAEYATDPRSLGVAPRPVADPVPPAASAACRSVLPRLPVELNPNLNPDYVADSEANVRCLREHGIPVHLYRDTSVWPDGLSWTYDSSDVELPADQGRIEEDCELAAFAD
jgi:hypothetical protein